MSDGVALEIDLEIAARPERVFRFFTDPDRFATWMGMESRLAAAAGGQVSIVLIGGDEVIGSVLELEPSRKLVFTWGYRDGKHGVQPGASTVTILLDPVPAGTRLRLRHEGLPTPESRDNHQMGWTHYVGRLSSEVTADAYAGVLAGLIDNVVRAWNETNGEKRLQILERCFDESGTFRDPMGSAHGRKHLAQYIGGVQQFAPGAKLELVSSPVLTHNQFCFQWRIAMANGGEMARGTNTGALTLDGRIQSITGFWGNAS